MEHTESEEEDPTEAGDPERDQAPPLSPGNSHTATDEETGEESEFARPLPPRKAHPRRNTEDAAVEQMLV